MFKLIPAALIAFTLHAQEHEEEMRHAMEEVQDAREELREAKREYYDGMVERNEREIEWKLDALGDPDDAPGPEEQDLRSKLVKLHEMRLTNRVVKADYRLRYEEARLSVMRLQRIHHAISFMRPQLQHEGIKADGFPRLQQVVQEKLKGVMLLQAYFEAKLDGEEEKAKAIAEKLGDKVPPPVKLEKPKEI
ncbi:MAG: hypothetical protein QF473_25450 [Planctomycetota bacterium]|jgi:hypothetical protein|nr:hypothetical protein [Planctomycetota bacterium]